MTSVPGADARGGAGERRRAALLLASLTAGIATLLAGPGLRAWPHLPPAGRVGACGFGPTCRDVGCHITFAEGSTSLSFDLHQDSPPAPLPAAYVPGRGYALRLDLTTTDTNVVRLGFELASITSCPTARDGGTLDVTDPLRTGLQSQGAVAYLAHACGCGTGSLDPTCCGVIPEALGASGWSFGWTAPPRGTGDVTFFMAFNEGNGDETASFDRISTGRVTLPEEACPAVVTDLRLRRTACDPGQPGVALLDLTWTRAGFAPPVVRSTDLAGLASARETWDLEPDACLPIDPRPLVFYSVADSCEMGSEGPH